MMFLPDWRIMRPRASRGLADHSIKDIVLPQGKRAIDRLGHIAARAAAPTSAIPRLHRFAYLAPAMQGLSISSPERDPPAIATRPRHEAHAYGAWATVAVIAITAVRLFWLAVQPADLYPDEAQYWFWALHPALGYYSKPPLVAWLIALTTGVFGDSEFAIRLSAPLLHAIAAGVVYAVAARRYDLRTRFLSAVAC